MIAIGVAGCGAVTLLYYLPAFKALEAEGRARVVALFDPDPGALAELGQAFPAAIATTSLDELLASGPDLLVVASPPKVHAGQALQALARGVAVHCEKPLALSADEGAEILRAAQAADRNVSVGLVRRSFPAVHAIAGLLARKAIGELASVDVFEGGPFAWPVRSVGYFSREQSGGGVLRDIGAHALDLLIRWLGEPEFGFYEDDAMGGVEANCRIGLRFGQTSVNVRLSRDWELPNRYLFRGAGGWISWTPWEPDRLELRLGDAGAQGSLALHAAAPGDAPALGAPAPDFQGAFTAHLRAAVDRLASPEPATARSLGLQALELIDQCYARRTAMEMPWLAPAAPLSLLAAAVA
jgi:predicted dehydrogenase